MKRDERIDGQLARGIGLEASPDGAALVERKIAVLVVDEEPLMAAVITSVLESEDDIRVIGLATSATEAMTRVASADVNVVLVSASLPDDGALELVRALTSDGHRASVVVTGLGLSEREVLAYVEAGAVAYVLKESGISDLLHTVRAAADGTALASPEIVRALMSRVSELVRLCSDVGIDVGGLPELSAREEEVLRLIAQGKTNQEIAETFDLSVGTVKQHVHNLLRKLNVSNRREAARYFRLMTTLGVPDEYEHPSSI